MEIDKLFGNKTATQALLFLARYEEATAGEIASAFSVPKTMIYLQLIKLEEAGIVSSRKMSNIKIYSFNSRMPIKKELRALLETYIEREMPIEQNKDFYLIRKRPRTKGKSLRGAYGK